MRKRIYKTLFIACLVLGATVPSRTYALTDETIPFLITMIANQVIEIVNMVVEFQEQYKRYEALASVPEQLYEEYKDASTDMMNQINQIGDALIGDAQNLLNSTKGASLDEISNYLDQTSLSLESARDAFLRWDIEDTKNKKKALDRMKSDINTQTTVLGQSQITNHALLVLADEIDALLDMTEQSQKIIVAEKSLEVNSEQAEERQKQKKFDEFWYGESNFSPEQRIKNNLFE